MTFRCGLMDVDFVVVYVAVLGLSDLSRWFPPIRALRLLCSLTTFRCGLMDVDFVVVFGDVQGLFDLIR